MSGSYTGGTTIGSIVDEYLITAGYEGRQAKARYLTMAIRGMKEIHYDVTAATTWSHLTLNEFHRACIPKDAIKLIGFFFESRDGLTPIVEGTKGVPPVDINADVYEGSIWKDDGVYNVVSEHWRNGRFAGGVYSGGGGNPYTYEVDFDLGEIAFSTNVPTRVVAQYLSDPKRVDGKFVVNPLVANAIMDYIWYADNRFKRGVSETEKARMHSRYVTSKTFAKMRMISQGIADLTDSRSKGTSLTSK